MPKWKPIRGKKKAPPSRTGAFGCVLGIILVLAFFVWSFYAMVSQ